MAALGIVSLIGAVAVAIGAPAGHPIAPAPISKDICTIPKGWSKPFKHVYDLAAGGRIVFIGVEHGDDPADASHQQIKAAFERDRPDFVLIEGVSSAKSAFDWYRKDIAALARQRVASGAVSENLFTAFLADRDHVAFSGWDFSPDMDLRVLTDDGFTMEDAIGAHLLRAKVDPFDEHSGQQVQRQLRYASAIRPVGVFDYAGWYRAAYGDRFDPANGTPCGAGIGARVINDLSYRRNANLAALMTAHAGRGHTVLVVAGGNHWLALRDWLRSRAMSEQ